MLQNEYEHSISYESACVSSKDSDPSSNSPEFDITKTCIYNSDPLQPHFFL